MEFRSSLFIMLIFLMSLVCYSQDVSDDVLFTIEGINTEAGEFIRMYNKNLAAEEHSDPDEYLQDYIDLKLKVTDAIKKGYDTTRSFIYELRGYRNQLAQNYLTDSKIKEELLERAYDRSLTEINAWHILVAMPSVATPADTLKGWEKAFDIRERIIKGESFEQVARGTSDDESVKINGGNLGYFTVFQMIMPFEDAAYNLDEGILSMPVRTPYGYHIIKVTGKRPARGRVKVAHIMKSAPPGSGESKAEEAEKEINRLYGLLQEGYSFEELARNYSDHKESAESGGQLDWFGAGEIINDFAEAAFTLTDTGTYTKPVKTIYGWHIIKLLDRSPPGTFEETRSYLESKINQSYLNSLGKKSLVERLKNEYDFTVNEETCEWFKDNTDTLIIQGVKRYDRADMPAENIYSFADQYVTSGEFADFIEKRGAMILTDNPSMFIEQSVDAKVSDHIIKYEDSVLEDKYPEFRYLMKEFHDGILLFEISALRIWNRAGTDSSGIIDYYSENKDNYLKPVGIDARIYTLKSENGKEALSSAFNKFSRRLKRDERLIKRFNKDNDSLLVIRSGVWYKGDDPDIDKLKWTRGSQSLNMEGYPSIITINRIIEPVPYDLEEIRGSVITDYQGYLEKEWIRQLKTEYNVRVDSAVFEKVKEILGNE